MDDVLHRFIDFERQLHLRQRPLGAGLRSVKRNLRFLVLERLHILADLRHFWNRRAEPRKGPVNRPSNPSFHQILEPRVAPGAFVMPPGGVEDAPLAVRAHPRPRFLRLLVLAVFEDGSIFFVVLRVDVSLVEALEALETLHDRMVRLRDGGAEGADAVRFELGADQLDVLFGIEEAIRRAMERDEALAGRDEIEQGGLLRRRDFGDIRIDQQSVIAPERLGVERINGVGVGQLDAAFFENRLQLAKPFHRLVMPVVAEEENLDRRRLGRQRDGQRDQQRQRERNGTHDLTLNMPGGGVEYCTDRLRDCLAAILPPGKVRTSDAQVEESFD